MRRSVRNRGVRNVIPALNPGAPMSILDCSRRLLRYAPFVMLSMLAGCGGEGTSSPASDPPAVVTPPGEEEGPRQPDPLPDPPPPVAQAPTRFTETAAYEDTGPLPISAKERYTFGKMVVVDNSRPSPGTRYDVPLAGWLRYPVEQRDGRTVPRANAPVVMFVHGMHWTCAFTPSDGPKAGQTQEVMVYPGEDCVPGKWTDELPNGGIGEYAQIDSAGGYDYLAADLASHGYFVISVDLNDVNARTAELTTETGLLGDGGAYPRAQVILKTLDYFRQVNRAPAGGGEPGLAGAMDFTRVGLMGHSRGGQAIAYAVALNNQRAGRPLEPGAKRMMPAAGGAAEPIVDLLRDYPLARTRASQPVDDWHDIRAALALAPTDFQRYRTVVNVPLGVIVPSCDGDVWNFQGLWLYDNNRYASGYDPSPKFLAVTMGANHNYYNTTWTADDAAALSGSILTDRFCKAGGADSIRLGAVEQRRGGRFLINSFMRYLVGGEQRFAAYWKGHARLPANACPDGDAVCDARVLLSVQRGVEKRRTIEAFTSGFTTAALLREKGWTLGEFDALAVCSPSTGACGGEPVVPGYSAVGQLQLVWQKAGEHAIVAPLAGVDSTGMDTLSFRMALWRDFAQDVTLTVRDRQGRSASVRAADFSDATLGRIGASLPVTFDGEWIPGMSAIPNMVAVPLGAFEGVDTTQLTSLRIDWANPVGNVAVTDLMLQRLR
jgi:hypothetical protein